MDFLNSNPEKTHTLHSCSSEHESENTTRLTNVLCRINVAQALHGLAHRRQPCLSKRNDTSLMPLRKSDFFKSRFLSLSLKISIAATSACMLCRVWNRGRRKLQEDAKIVFFDIETTIATWLLCKPPFSRESCFEFVAFYRDHKRCQNFRVHHNA